MSGRQPERSAGDFTVEETLDASYFERLLGVAKRFRHFFGEEDIEELTALAGNLRSNPELAKDLARWFSGASKIAVLAIEDKFSKQGAEI